MSNVCTLYIAENRLEILQYTIYVQYTLYIIQLWPNQYTWSGERMSPSLRPSIATNTWAHLKKHKQDNLIFAEFLLGLRRTMAQAVLIDVCSWKNLTHNIHTHISLQIWLNRKVCLGLRHGWQADLRLPMDQSLTKLYFLCMSQM